MPIIFWGIAAAIAAAGTLIGVGAMKAEIEAGKGTAAAAEAIGKAAGFAIIAGTAIYLIGSRKK